MTLVAHAIGRVLSDPPAGLGGGPLVRIAAEDLVLWASERSAELGRDDALEHHRIVEELCRRGPCLPVRFGTRFADADAAASVLSERGAQLAESLARVGGRQELAITLLWADAPVAEGRGHREAAAGRPGTAYLDAVRARHSAEAGRRSLAEGLAERLAAELAVDRAAVRHTICPSAAVALSTAILAPLGGAERLKEEAVRSASRLPGVRAVVSGPWPPYSFAGLP
jgi:hypothetical protein